MMNYKVVDLYLSSHVASYDLLRDNMQEKKGT